MLGGLVVSRCFGTGVLSDLQPGVGGGGAGGPGRSKVGPASPAGSVRPKEEAASLLQDTRERGLIEAGFGGLAASPQAVASQELAHSTTVHLPPGAPPTHILLICSHLQEKVHLLESGRRDSHPDS